MSNVADIKYLEMTPRQLAGKLRGVVEQLKNTAHDEDNCGYQARFDLSHRSLNADDPQTFSKDVVAFIPTHRMKQFCPELFDQLITPAIAGSKMQKPFINYVGLDITKNGIAYSKRSNAINIGMDYLENMQSMAEAVNAVTKTLPGAEQTIPRGLRTVQGTQKSQRGGIISL